MEEKNLMGLFGSATLSAEIRKSAHLAPEILYLFSPVKSTLFKIRDVCKYSTALSIFQSCINNSVWVHKSRTSGRGGDQSLYRCCG